MSSSKVIEADRQEACKVVGGLEGCPATRQVLTRVGDKWSAMVIVLLGCGTKRFGELKRLTDGISQRMLTLTLRGLERDGLVQRSVYAAVPPRVEYLLTPLGRTLLEPLSLLAQWATRHKADIERARDEFDARERAESADVRDADAAYSPGT